MKMFFQFSNLTLIVKIKDVLSSEFISSACMMNFNVKKKEQNEHRSRKLRFVNLHSVYLKVEF